VLTVQPVTVAAGSSVEGKTGVRVDVVIKAAPTAARTGRADRVEHTERQRGLACIGIASRQHAITVSEETLILWLRLCFGPEADRVLGSGVVSR